MTELLDAPVSAGLRRGERGCFSSGTRTRQGAASMKMGSGEFLVKTFDWSGVWNKKCCV